jgi:transcriptional regulator
MKPITTNKGAKGERIDLGLSLLSLRTPPGVPVSQVEIAAWCGCRKQNISYLERRALRKLRFKARAALRELAASYALPFTH